MRKSIFASGRVRRVALFVLGVATRTNSILSVLGISRRGSPLSACFVGGAYTSALRCRS